MIWKRIIWAWMALLTLVFASASASAHPDVSPKPHVGGIDLAVASAIGVNGLVSPEEHRGKRCFATTDTSDVPLAARGVARVSTVAGKTLNQTVGKTVANTVRDVLKGRANLSSLAVQERAGAAAFYRNVATRTGGREAAAASRYNIARAEYLEGTRSSLSSSLPEFIKNGFK